VFDDMLFISIILLGFGLDTSSLVMSRMFLNLYDNKSVCLLSNTQSMTTFIIQLVILLNPSMNRSRPLLLQSPGIFKTKILSPKRYISISSRNLQPSAWKVNTLG